VFAEFKNYFKLRFRGNANRLRKLRRAGPDALDTVDEPGDDVRGKRRSDEETIGWRLVQLTEKHRGLGHEGLGALTWGEDTGMEVEGAAARENVSRLWAFELEEDTARREVDYTPVIGPDRSAERLEDRGARGGRADHEPLFGSEPEAVA
jgi:hypothetical protein